MNSPRLTASDAVMDRPMALSVNPLSKRYKEQRGLLASSFTVREGELIAVVGHNGAGKSTLLKLLGGWLVRNLLDYFSVEYNLALFARLSRMPPSRVEEMLEEFSLVPYRHNKVRTLSKGMKQRVSVGRSLLADPSLLLFDEPTSGLDFAREFVRKSVHMLLAARPARRNSCSQQDLYWYKDCLMQEEIGWRRGGTGNKLHEKRNMNILEHSDQGATIKLDQRELLLVMALVQEGRESFGCNTESGKALDELFSSANLLVEESRRRAVGKPVIRQKIHLVADPARTQVIAVSK